MALLLSPHRIFSDGAVLSFIQVTRSPKGVDLVTKALDNVEIRRSFSGISKEAKDVLFQLSKEAIGDLRAEIRRTFELQQSDLPYEAYSKAALTRKLYERLLKFKPFAAEVKWYHSVPTEKGNVKTAPCTFSSYKPQLAFEVVKDGDRFLLQATVTLNGSLYPLALFSRYAFLLESNNEYFLLSYKDNQTLEWLEKINPAQFQSDPQALTREVLSRLEMDYPVNRNNCFTATVIDQPPVSRIMLSEISNSFLVITPQWLYDGFLAEGPWQEKTEVVRNGDLYMLLRHKDTEKAFSEMLQALHPGFAKQRNGYFHISFAEAQKKQWFLKVYHKLLEMDVPVVGMDMLQHFRYSPYKPETKISIKEKEDTGALLVDFQLFFGEEEVSLAELRKILLAGQRAVLLKDGSLGVLGEEWLSRYSAILKHGKIQSGKKTKQVEVARWMALNEEKAVEGTEVLKPVLPKDWWQKWHRWQQPGENIYPVPSTVHATLRPYQKKGYEWMLLLSEAGAGACLADDMGLGKSLQTICVLAGRSQQFPGLPHLVVCPATLIYNWVQELEKFTPSLSKMVYHGPSRNFEQLKEKGIDVIITSYGTLRSDVELMASLSFSTVVIDESQNIKNPASQITRTVNQLNAMMRIALSGTPIMNNTFDLYAQLDFLLPGMFGSREFFKTEYADPIDRDADADKTRALQKLTAPFVLRRTKEQVAPDLPEKTETILWCHMGNDQRMAYESIRENIRSSITLEIQNKGLQAGKLSVLHGMMKLRQVCNSCELVKDEDLFSYDSIKTEVLVQELENITANHKALVFSQFTQMLDLLEKALVKNNIPFCRLDGNTKIADRQLLVNRFQQSDSHERVFLISLKAGNAGLNLTAADYVFLFDPWWNTAVQQQAIDRTHRIGQTKNVFAYKMICKDTIEEKIIQLQQRKKKLADELISEDEGFVKSLTEEDVAFLFG